MGTKFGCIGVIRSSRPGKEDGALATEVPEPTVVPSFRGLGAELSASARYCGRLSLLVGS